MSFDSGSPTNNPALSGQDRELADFLSIEEQKAQFQMQIHKLTDTCWDTCIDKPRDRLGAAETCLSNCVDRFIDTSLLIANRFQQQLMQRSGQ